MSALMRSAPDQSNPRLAWVAAFAAMTVVGFGGLEPSILLAAGGVS
jgi:hypothetical protein